MTSAVVFLAAGDFVACSASSGGGPSDGDGGAVDGVGIPAGDSSSDAASDHRADAGLADAQDGVADAAGGSATDQTVADGASAVDATSSADVAGLDVASTDVVSSDVAVDGGASDASDDTDGSGASSEFSPCESLGIAQVRAVAYLPDGSAVAAAMGGAVVKLIAPSDGHEIRSMLGHSGAVNAVVVSNDGSTLVTASDDRTVRLWRSSDGVALGTLVAHASALLSVAISPDGTHVAAGAADGEVFLWDLATMSLVGAAEIPGGDAASSPTDSGPSAFAVDGIAFAAAGARILTASSDGSLRAWSAVDLTSVSTLKPSGPSIRALAVSPDGQRVATGDIQGTLAFWNASNGMLESQATATYGISQLAFAADGTRVYAVSGGTSVYAYPVDGSASTLITAPIGSSAVVVASPDGKALFVATDWALLLLDGTGKALRPDVQQGPFARSVAFWPDGSQLLIGGDFGSVVRSLPGGAIAQAPAWSQSTPLVNGVAVSSDGALFATGDDTGSVQLWSTSTWQSIKQIVMASVRAQDVDFSPDSKLLAAVGSDSLDDVYQVPSGASVSFLAFSGSIHSVLFSPDGSRIAVGTDLGELGILNTSDWSDVARITAAHSYNTDVAFSPDGSVVATTGDQRVTLWQVGDASPMRQDVLDESGFVGSTVAISHDGALLAAGGSDGTVRLWGLPTAVPLPDLPAHGPAVFAARFSPDGRQLAVAYSDGTVWLWCHP